MSILILSRLDDAHGCAVSWALAQNGVRADTIYFSDFPQKMSLSYGGELGAFELSGPEALTMQAWDVIWDRRAGFCSPHADLHKEDWRMSRAMGTRFLDSFRYSVSRDAYCINPLQSATRAEDKIFQLDLARRVGFQIPATLVSNDVDRIRRFISDGGEYICKSLGPMSWVAEKALIVVQTTRVCAEDLQDEIAVSACPMIYQRRVSKALEYRVFVAGRDMIIAELASQDDERSALDWRAHPASVPVREGVLERDIVEKIFKFMDVAGLACGSFDLARTESGEIIFFEINQQGQFLWLEDTNAQIPALDFFTRFLLSNLPEAGDKRSHVTVSWGDFLASGAWNTFQETAGPHHAKHISGEQDRIYRDR